MNEIETDAPEAMVEKKKSKKKPKLTKAEKKILKKELALKRKQLAYEKICQRKRDYLIREINYSDINRKKLEKQWRQTLFDIKIPMLRKELRFTVNNIERLFDAKDFKISILMDEIDEANEQTTLNNQTHLEAIEKLIEIFRDQLNRLKSKYDEDIAAINNDENNSIQLLTKRRDYNCDFLHVMLYGLDIENKYEIKNIRSEYMSKISGETTWYDQVLMNKKIEVQGAFDHMYERYTETFNNYLNSENRRPYEKIRQNDSNSRKLLNQQSNKILSCYETIKRLKDAEILQNNELNTIEEQMIQEKEHFSEAFRVLKNRLIVNERKDEEKLVELTERSNSFINHLKEIKQKGERILRFMTLCSKYETQEEQILPFPVMTTAKNLVKSLPMLPHKDDSQTWIALQQEASKNLNSFWQKFAGVDTTRHVLKEEEVILKKENAYLERKIKKYCEQGACRCMFPQVSQLRNPKTETKSKIKVKTIENDIPLKQIPISQFIIDELTHRCQ